VSSQSQFQSRQQVQTLFAQGRQVASNATKGFSSCLAAKAARDFLLDFGHANIALGLRIVKRNRQAFQEKQDGILVGAKAVQQISSRTLFLAPTFAGLDPIREGYQCEKTRAIRKERNLDRASPPSKVSFKGSINVNSREDLSNVFLAHPRF